jgi:hypothetical protein
MEDDLEKKLLSLSDDLKRKLLIYEGKKREPVSTLIPKMTPEDREFFERLRRLTPQFATIQSMFARWQELAGLK